MQSASFYVEAAVCASRKQTCPTQAGGIGFVLYWLE